MRKQVKVIYGLNLIVSGGEEITEEFSLTFDHEIYNDDIDATDIMSVSFKMQEMKEKYGEDVFLESFYIEREEET